MDIAELSVRRPVLMTMVYVLISVIALVFLPRLDMALYPEVDMPVISVSVSCGDAGPEEVELQVTEIMEDSLDSLENLDTMTSISREGRSMVILEFDYGTDLDDAAEDVNTIVSMLSRRLPDWAENPTVFRFDSAGSGSIMRLTITGDRTKDELQYIAENTVQPLLERIEGVSQVNVYGGAPVEYDIDVDPNRLEAYGLTLSQISAQVAARNVQSTGGEITQRGKDYQIMTDARYFTLEDIRQTIVGYTGLGTPILLQDVAEVRKATESGNHAESRAMKAGRGVSFVSASHVESPCQPSSKRCISTGMPARRSALYSASEFSTGTQSSGVVAQRKAGGASCGTCFSREYASGGTFPPQKLRKESPCVGDTQVTTG